MQQSVDSQYRREPILRRRIPTEVSKGESRSNTRSPRVSLQTNVFGVCGQDDGQCIPGPLAEVDRGGTLNTECIMPLPRTRNPCRGQFLSFSSDLSRLF